MSFHNYDPDFDPSSRGIIYIAFGLLMFLLIYVLGNLP